LGDHDGSIDLFVPRSYSGTAGLFLKHSGTHHFKIVKVPLRRFDEAVDWEKCPGSVFLKVDIEGSEFAFLKGARNMICAKRPLLLLEINPVALEASKTTEKDFVNLLKNYGFQFYRQIEDLNTFHSIDNLTIDTFQDIIVSQLDKDK
jgi:hypothetical protein